MPVNASATRSTSVKRFMPPKLRRTALGGMTICVNYSLNRRQNLYVTFKLKLRPGR